MNETNMSTTLTSLQLKRLYTTQWKRINAKQAWAGAAKRNAKRRAEAKGIPFNLTIKYLMSIVTDNCPVYNTPFVWHGNKVTGNLSPSIDRIDPIKGYVEGNVVVISSKANNIKSAYKSSDIFKVAEWLQTIENKG
jgi:hypothetical protein